MEQYRQFTLPNRLSVEQAAYFLEQISALSHVGGWEYDVQTHQTVWLDETYRIHDLLIDSPLDEKQVLALFDPSEQIRIKHKLDLAVNNAVGFHAAFNKLTAKGRAMRVVMTCVPVLNDGRVIKLVGVLQDVTAESELRKGVDKQERSVQAKVLDGLIAELETTRSSIAFQLHEEIAQLISASLMQIQIGEMAKESTEPHLKEGLAALKLALQRINELYKKLDVPDLTCLPFDHLLEHRIHQHKHEEQVVINLKNRKQINELPFATKTFIYRILVMYLDQLGILGVESRLELDLHKEETDIVMELRFLGGFPSLMGNNQTARLAFLHARSSQTNGDVRIELQKSKQHKITVRIPIEHHD